MHTSLPARETAHPSEPRDVKRVPFVELFDRRLQGVVSSGSDIQRVYVAFFEAGTLHYSCGTNNNRPCGGLRGTPCSHLDELLHEAIVQYGPGRVARFLRLPGDPAQYHDARTMLAHAGQQVSEPASAIFTRFLAQLELLELPPEDTPLHALAWFG